MLVWSCVMKMHLMIHHFDKLKIETLRSLEEKEVGQKLGR